MSASPTLRNAKARTTVTPNPPTQHRTAISASIVLLPEPDYYTTSQWRTPGVRSIHHRETVLTILSREHWTRINLKLSAHSALPLLHMISIRRTRQKRRKGRRKRKKRIHSPIAMGLSRSLRFDSYPVSARGCGLAKFPQTLPSNRARI